MVLSIADYPYDLGSRARSRSITTTNAEAQGWFDRGLIWCYAFHHEEAVRCFEQCVAHDPDAAMGYWGIAYALGGDYNHQWKLFGVGEIEEVLPKIKEAVDKAKAAEGASDVERMLIAALDARMPESEDDWDFSAWDKRYLLGIKRVYDLYPDDLDIVCLYAEAMMIQTPWNLWDLQTGEPTPGAHTLEAERVLERALADPRSDHHAGLLHFYIHLEEMSQHPEKAVVAGDKLLHLVPDGGHAVHMPSHLDILIGDYRRAITSNALAIEADAKYIKIHGLDGFFTTYAQHNYNSLVYAAMFNGQSKLALQYTEGLETLCSSDWCLDVHGDFMEAQLSTRIHVYVRFGIWQDLIEMETPLDTVKMSVTTAFAHYGKGIAYAATNRVSEALAERDLFAKAVARVPPTRLIFPNKASEVLKIGFEMLDGEIEYRRGNYDVAFKHLRQAIVNYDSILYCEPWGWMQPTRHTYAALKLERGEVEEALQAYAEDLGYDDKVKRSFWHPKNVWALHGYHECLIRLGRTAEAKIIRPELDLALAVADIKIESSCFCRIDFKADLAEGGNAASGRAGCCTS